VFDNTSTRFTGIDIYSIIEHFYHRPPVLSDNTLSFIATIKKANDAREGLSRLNADLGPRGRNRVRAPSRPEGLLVSRSD
jgi:hypothetical protein